MGKISRKERRGMVVKTEVGNIIFNLTERGPYGKIYISSRQQNFEENNFFCYGSLFVYLDEDEHVFILVGLMTPRKGDSKK